MMPILAEIPGETLPPIQIDTIELSLPVEARSLPRFDRPLEVNVRQATLLSNSPWARSLGKLELSITTQSWRFPTPPDQSNPVARPRLAELGHDGPAEQPAT